MVVFLYSASASNRFPFVSVNSHSRHIHSQNKSKYISPLSECFSLSVFLLLIVKHMCMRFVHMLVVYIINRRWCCITYYVRLAVTITSATFYPSACELFVYACVCVCVRIFSTRICQQSDIVGKSLPNRQLNLCYVFCSVGRIQGKLLSILRQSNEKRLRKFSRFS